MAELREMIVKHRPEVVILDMEMACLSEVEWLHREFNGVCIVATHRLADEEMWTAALTAGAADICSSRDTPGIVNAAVRNAPSIMRSAAA